jgi:choline dehydrogenase
MTYIRGQKAQIDVWSQLGISGWNWDILLPYYKKAEHFDPPTPAQVAAGASYDPEFHGMHGPVHVGYQYELQNGSFYDTVRQTWRNLGQSLNREANGGDVHGFSVWPKTAVRDKGLRADAAQAYYYPVQGRHNLKVIKGTVTKIRWKSSSHSSHLVTANAVEYIDGHGKTAIVKAQKEVVLSAGSLRTPALLELSGIGNPKWVFWRIWFQGFTRL